MTKAIVKKSLPSVTIIPFMHRYREILLFCIDLVLPPRRTERLLRGVSLQTLEHLEKPRIHPTHEALLPYGDSRVMALIWELKYYDSLHAARLGGSILAAYVSGVVAEECIDRPLLCAVPLHRKRTKERGYNQSERLCQQIVKILQSDLLYIPNLLVRTRVTARQTELPRHKRLSNVRGAFTTPTPTQIVGRTVILIDDVVTTGSTLKACTDTLYAAGAAQVIPIALAYAEVA